MDAREADEEATHAIYVGDVHELDTALWRMRATLELHLPRPLRRLDAEPDEIMLLATASSAEAGQLVCAVGYAVCVRVEGRVLGLHRVERFVVPVVLPIAGSGSWRETVGKVLSEGERGLLRVPVSVREEAERRAREVLTPSTSPDEVPRSRLGPGFARVHLVAADDDFVTCVLPVDATGKLDRARSVPWLVKSKWGARTLYGELRAGRPGEPNRIEWAGDDPDSVTTLGISPLAVGSTVVIHEDDEHSKLWSFQVRDFQLL